VWTRLPEVFRFLSKLGIRKRTLLRMNDMLVARTPAQLPARLQPASPLASGSEQGLTGSA
jgi:hypothetical protein